MTNPTIIAVASGSAQSTIANALTSVINLVKKNPTIDWTSTLLDLLKDLSPVAQPEQLIYIYGYGFDSSGTQVRAVGITQLPNLRIKSQSVIASLNIPIINISQQIFEIQAYMPSLRQLQTSKYYAPNAILLWGCRLRLLIIIIFRPHSDFLPDFRRRLSINARKITL